MIAIQTEADYSLTNRSNLFPLNILFQLHMWDSEFEEVVLCRVRAECEAEGRECMRNCVGET